MRVRTSIVLAAVLAVGILVGTRLESIITPSPAGAAASPPADGRRWETSEYAEKDPTVTCPADAAIIVALGQSNAANSVGHRFTSSRPVFEMHDGRCYAARGALAGADLAYGSYWPLVGDILVARGVAPSVAFVGLAKGNTTVAQWADPAELGGYLARKLRALHGVRYVLWHQGEADTRTPMAQYAADLRRVIAIVKEGAPGAKVLIAQTSLCSGGRESVALLEAQASVVDPAGSVFAGPNTDTVRGFEDRYDGCHLSERGARAVAKLWAEKIVEAR